MSLLDDASNDVRSAEQSRDPEGDPHPMADREPATVPVAGTSVPIDGRAASVTVDGDEVDLEDVDTEQTGENTWLTGEQKYGLPRGREVLEARQISETSAMQAIGNGIVDQLLGGELAAESDGELAGTAADVWSLLRDVLHGPHLMGDDLDDLITAAVFDMLGPGNAYWQLIGAPAQDLPVATLKPLDAVTIRHAFTPNGVPEDPPYWQARGAFGPDGVSALGSIDPTPLEADDLAVMHYPRGRRGHRWYPLSPSIQVREWLEILTNSTIHHNRFYDDNQIPPGLLQILNASPTEIDDIEDDIQAAAGDPRNVEVIGGEGQAMWVEMGGTAVNLDVIQEQQWFFQLCLGSLGLGKAELGFIEDANRSNGEIEATRVYKRVAGPFAKQFQGAFAHVASQFDAYAALDEPFDIRLRFTDPREERAREERLRKMYQDGGLTLREYVRRRGDEDLAEDDDRFAVETPDGDVVEYGDVPLWVAKRKVDAALGTSMDAEEDPDAGDDEDDEDGDAGAPAATVDGRD